MANIKSAIKRNRQNEKRRMRNKGKRSAMRTQTKAAIAAAGTDESAETLRLAIKKIDKSAAKGIIHKNKAARMKSRLIAQIRRIEAGEA